MRLKKESPLDSLELISGANIFFRSQIYTQNFTLQIKSLVCQVPYNNLTNGQKLSNGIGGLNER